MKKIAGHTWYTLDEVFAKDLKSKTFRDNVAKEVARLELLHEMRVARNKKRMTQATLAKKAGMPQSVIARIESGRKGITLDTLIRIGAALGKKVQLV